MRRGHASVPSEATVDVRSQRPGPGGLQLDGKLGGAHTRPPRRAGRVYWVLWTNIDRLILAFAFGGALTCGYITSTWLWELEFADGPNSLAHYQTSLDDLLTQVDEELSRESEAIAPPYTRAKYLKYFRPLNIGDDSLQRRGGNRRIDQRTAAEFDLFYEREGLVVERSHAFEVPEDELWDEVTYKGRKVVKEADYQHTRMLHTRLEELIDEEFTYDPDRPLAPGESPTAFKLLPVNSMDLYTRQYACSAQERHADPPMHDSRRALFILGAQKGGTTFLFNALTRHHAFVGADHAYGQRRGIWSKEVHFFNQWPLPQPAKLEYIKVFPSFTWSIPTTNSTDVSHMYTLLDGTPEYLFNTMAAPRIKAMWPQAKFVVLLRDPVTRAYSAWKMSMRMACKKQAKLKPSAVCTFPTFAESVMAEIALLKKWGCTFSRKGEKSPKTWADCYRCKVSFPDQAACDRAWWWDRGPCTGPPFLTLSVSMYAAQISWWFAHFPRDSFMFIRSHDLHKRNSVDLLNDILEFTGIKASHFQHYMLRNVWGYNGQYNMKELSDLDIKAMQFLRLFFRQADADLQYLLGPEFQGLPHDVNLTANEQPYVYRQVGGQVQAFNLTGTAILSTVHGAAV